MAEHVELNSTTFDKALDSTLPVAVDFYADWCGPCKEVAPIIDELTKEYRGKIIFMRLNVDENSRVADRYEIISIPTLIVFSKGKAIRKIVGARKIEGYRSELDEILGSS
jgi:thioredoxin 1